MGAGTTAEEAAEVAVVLVLGLGGAALVARGAALGLAELESAGEHALPRVKQARKRAQQSG